MAKYSDREWRVGEYWLGQRPNSPAWYAFRYDAAKRQNVRVSLGTTCFEQAKERLADLYHKNRTIKDAKPSELSMAEVLGRYWEHHGKGVAAARTIKGQIKHWLEFYGDKNVASACSYARQNEFKAWLKGKGLGASTINHTLMVGRAACRMAWKRGELTSVPPFEMVKVGEQAPMGRPLTVDEMAACLREAHEPHMKTLLMFLIGTAARPAAVMELRWEQVDRAARLIYLNAVGREQSKKRRPTVRLPDALAGLSGDGWVVSYKGKPVRSVKVSWRKLRARAGLGDDVTLYSFRHSVARWMRGQGVPLEDIQLQLGHALPPVTARYVGFAPDYLLEAKRAIDTLFCQLQASRYTDNPQKAGVAQW